MSFDNDIKRKLGANGFHPSESLQQSSRRRSYNNYLKSIKSEARSEDRTAQNMDKILKTDANFPDLDDNSINEMESIQMRGEDKKRKKNNSSP